MYIPEDVKKIIYEALRDYRQACFFNSSATKGISYEDSKRRSDIVEKWMRGEK